MSKEYREQARQALSGAESIISAIIHPIKDVLDQPKRFQHELRDSDSPLHVAVITHQAVESMLDAASECNSVEVWLSFQVLLNNVSKYKEKIKGLSEYLEEDEASITRRTVSAIGGIDNAIGAAAKGAVDSLGSCRCRTNEPVPSKWVEEYVERTLLPELMRGKRPKMLDWGSR